MKYAFLFIIFAVVVYCSEKETIFHLIKSTNGFIFNQMRDFKKNFHPEIQQVIENTIKEYEYRYLSSKEKFVDYLWDKFSEIKSKYGEINNHEAEFNSEVMDLLKDFMNFYDNLEKVDKMSVEQIIEAQDEFTKKTIRSMIDKSHIFDDKKYNNLYNIIEQLPLNLINNKNSTLLPKIKIKVQFKEFLKTIIDQHNIHDLNHNLTKEIKNKKIEKIKNDLSKEQKKHFQVLFRSI